MLLLHDCLETCKKGAGSAGKHQNELDFLVCFELKSEAELTTHKTHVTLQLVFWLFGVNKHELQKQTTGDGRAFSVNKH